LQQITNRQLRRAVSTGPGRYTIFRWDAQRRKRLVQFRPELRHPTTPLSPACCETRRFANASKFPPPRYAPLAEICAAQVVSWTRLPPICRAAFSFLSFGALGANRTTTLQQRGRGNAAAMRGSLNPFGWPVGSVTTIASVVDLPLATPAAQSVFGASQTPVFISWRPFPNALCRFRVAEGLGESDFDGPQDV
jgi:hypothetical protein